MTNELYHHGILGQKWGKRNGPPYPLDGDDHSAREKKVGWRKSLDKSSGSASKATAIKKKSNNSYIYKESYEYFKKMGYSNAEAKALAEKRVKMYRNVLIAAGVTAGVVLGGSIAYKVGTNYVDYVIKAGTTLQTLSKDPDRIQKGHLFYTNYLKLDKNIYAGSGFARTFSTTPGVIGKVYKNKIQVKTLQDMKIASDKSAQKIFTEAFQSPEAKQVFDEVKRHYVDHPDHIDTRIVRLIERAESGDIAKYANSKLGYVSRPFQGKGKHLTQYEVFNRSIMPLDDPQAVKITKVFTDALEKKGYAGVLDINDTKVSNLRGIRPTIITDRSKVDIMNAVSKPLTEAEHQKLRSVSSKGMLTLNSLDEHPAAMSLYMSMVTGGLGCYAISVSDAIAEINSPKYKNKDKDKSQ